jgi:uncharacterized protein
LLILETSKLKTKQPMALEEKINADIKTAMLAKEAQKLEALRAIKSAILLLKTSPEGYSDDTELKAMQKMVKQRKETAEIYKEQGRADLADTELYQAGIIEAYLPKQLTPDELREALKQVIATVGATSAADMGKTIGAANKALVGKADGKSISAMVKELLSA